MKLAQQYNRESNRGVSLYHNRQKRQKVNQNMKPDSDSISIMTAHLRAYDLQALTLYKVAEEAKLERK